MKLDNALNGGILMITTRSDINRKSAAYRLLSWVLTLAVLFSMLTVGSLTGNAAEANTGGFKLTLCWNGNVSDKNNYVYDSSSDETRLVRLKVIFENKEVTSGYEPGQMVISVPGLGEAARSGTLSLAAVAADPADSTEKIYNWSYTYSSTNDTFVFTNNTAIHSGVTFEGSFEMIWSVDSRDTKHNYSHSITALLRTANNEQVQSNTVTYRQTRVRDVFAFDSDASASNIYSYYGLEDYLPSDSNPSDYTWIKYEFPMTEDLKARGLQDGKSYKIMVPSGAFAGGQGVTYTGTTTTIDGVSYKVYDADSSAITTAADDVLILNCYVVYPKSQYYGRNVRVRAEMYGTYYEESSQVRLSYKDVTVNTRDYNFIDIPGAIYKSWKTSYGVYSNYIKDHCKDCENNGAINSAHLSGGREYSSDISFFVNYNTLNIPYDVEITDDIFDVMTLSGYYRQLNDDEYHFTTLLLPSVYRFKNSNFVSVKPDTIQTQIYVRYANTTAYVLYHTTYIKSYAQTLSLPANTVGVKVAFRKNQEFIEDGLFRLSYQFHTNASDIVINGGKIVNNMFIDLYRNSNHSLINTEYNTPSVYETSREYNRDIALYGRGVDREKDTIHILEFPNELSSKTKLQMYNEATDKEAYIFDGSIESKFDLTEGNTLGKFSVYTIVPGGLILQELYDTPENLLDHITVSDGYHSQSYLKGHMNIEIINNYKNSGRQYIAFHFDLSGNPISSSDSVTISDIPMKSYKENYLGRVYISPEMHSITTIDQTGRWYASYTDSQTLENGIWKDIDRDNNITEHVAYSQDRVAWYIPEHSFLDFSKSVQTTLTNGYVHTPYDNSTHQYKEETLAYTYRNSEYSYKLKLETGNNTTDRILFCDVLENGPNKVWQGTFSRVDTSYIRKHYGSSGTIYYSSYVEDVSSRPDLSSGHWTTTRPSVVKSVAVDFGDMAVPEGRTVYIEIVMKSPVNPDNSLYNKITENDSHVFYEKCSDTMERTQEDLPSNYVAVGLMFYRGKLRLRKVDATNDVLLAGAKFDLYELNSSGTPDPAHDRKVNTAPMVTDDMGTAELVVPYGKYYAIETEAPLGYELDSTPKIINFQFDLPDQSILTVIPDPRKPGQFVLKKVSDRNPNRTLAGAEFALYKADGTRINESTTYVTGTDGILTIDGLEWGDYYVIETKAPIGYKLPAEPQKISFTVYADNDAGHAVASYVLENEQLPASAILTKSEMLEDKTTITDVKLSGAVYQLYNAANNKLVGTYMTDSDGKIYADNLAYGTYYFKESIPAQGYDVTPANAVSDLTFTIDESNLQADNVARVTINTHDPRLLGRLWLQKVDEDGFPVKGAVFGMFDAATNTQVDPQGRPSTVTYTTNEEGIIEIPTVAGNEPCIWWGSYYMQELQAPKGYELDTTKYSFVVDATTVNNVFIFDGVVNTRKKGSVVLTKVDETNESVVLSGAVFALYRNNGTLVRDNLITNASGQITVTGLDWGSYYFEEVTPPPNYGLNPEKIRFTVNSVSAGITQYLTVTDKPSTGELTVIKRIKIADIVFAHGDPTFTFRLDGKDTSGKAVYAYRSVTFGEDYVRSYANAHPTEENIELSFTFNDLTAGTWTVTECDTVRYKLTNIEKLRGTGTITLSDKKIAFVFNSTNGYYGTARFTNTKIVQSATSHTNQVQNLLKTKRKVTALSATLNATSLPAEAINRSKLDVYAFYDDGTQRKLGNNEYTLDPDTLEGYDNGDYTIHVSYTEDGRTVSDDVFVHIDSSTLFTYTVTEGKFTENGKTYDGTAVVNGYFGSSSIIRVPSYVRGINTFYLSSSYTDRPVVGGARYTDNGEIYKVVGVEGFSEAIEASYSTGKYYSMINFYRDRVTSVILPDTLTFIGDNAFRELKNLKSSITIPANVTSIGNYAFFNCTGLIGSLVIPNSVTSIGDYAFYRCEGFNGTLTLGSGLQTIGRHAFFYCTGFTGSLNIQNNVTTIGSYAFYRCTGFNGTLKLCSSATAGKLQTVGECAFYQCSGFTGGLTFPNSIVSIGRYAFYECTGFNSTLKLCSSATAGKLQTIGEYAFYECSGFTGGLIIPNTTETIEQYAFYKCSGLNSTLTLGSTVQAAKLQTIGYAAFSNCSGFTGALKIPNSTVTIGDYAFSSCYGFTSTLTFGSGATASVLQTIGKGAFSGCYGFTGSLVIPNSTLTIGDSAFSNCYGFKSTLSFGSSAAASVLQTIGNSAFYNCYGFTGALTIPNKVTTIGNGAFRLKNPSSYSNPTLTASQTMGFNGKLTLGSSVTSIGSNAFFGCQKFTGTLTIPNTVTTLGSYAFYHCKGFTSLTLGSGINVINEFVFANCSGFKGTLTIPSIITSIGQYAFYNCSGFTGSLTIPNNVTSIGDYSFYLCTGLTGNLTIGNSVTTVGAYAFGQNESFKGKLTIGSSVKVLKDGAFWNCKFTGSLTLPSSLTTIGYGVFCMGTGYTGALTIPNSVKSIGASAFWYCSELNGTLTMSNSVTSIGQQAFEYCMKLTGTVTIPTTITSIGDNAFNQCNKLTRLRIPRALTTSATYGMPSSKVTYY